MVDSDTHHVAWPSTCLPWCACAVWASIFSATTPRACTCCSNCCLRENELRVCVRAVRDSTPWQTRCKQGRSINSTSIFSSNVCQCMHACRGLRCLIHARSLLHVATHKQRSMTALASLLSGQGSAKVRDCLLPRLSEVGDMIDVVFLTLVNVNSERRGAIVHTCHEAFGSMNNLHVHVHVSYLYQSKPRTRQVLACSSVQSSSQHICQPGNARRWHPHDRNLAADSR